MQESQNLTDQTEHSPLHGELKSKIEQKKEQNFRTVSKNEEKLVYFTMPRYGQSLRQIFKYFKKQISTQSIYSLGLTLIDIFELIHNSGLVYNDLKPDNIMVDYHSKLPEPNLENSSKFFKDARIYLIDFGLSSKWRDCSTGHHCHQKSLNVFEGNLYLSSVD